jgi:hypothetical protein
MKKKEVLSKWVAIPGMERFVEYFSKQWLTGKFTNWQIWHTPPGFASTDNPCESFNGKLKELFTLREKLSVVGFLKIALDQLVPFYSMNYRDFLFYRLPNKTCRSAAAELQASNFKKISENIVRYSDNTNIHRIDFTHNSCSCRFYLAYAICAHIVAACKIFDRQLNGAKTFRNYVYRSKRGAKPKAQPAAQYLLQQKRPLEDDEDEEESSHVAKKPTLETSPVAVAAVAGAGINDLATKRSRGRPRKLVEELQSKETIEKRKRGRPKKASTALIAD